MENKKLITPEDTDCIKEVYDYYDLKMPPRLIKAIDNFKKNPSEKAQDQLKLVLACEVSAFKNNPTLKEIFEPLIAASDEIAYDMQFDKDVDELLNEDDDKEDKE